MLRIADVLAKKTIQHGFTAVQLKLISAKPIP